MNTLLLFNRPVVVPDDNDEKLEIYGLVVDHDKWESSPFKTDYIYRYLLVVAELYKEGIVSKHGLDFEKDGVTFYYDDPTWKEYEERVRESDLRYAIVEDAVEIDEGDYFETSLTNREKWSELIEKGGFVWL